jgi:hypothetical protein
MISRFMVPVLHIEIAPMALVTGAQAGGPALPTSPPAQALPPSASVPALPAAPPSPAAEEPWVVFSRRIAAASTLPELGTIGTEIRTATFEYHHKERLRAEWYNRRSQLTAAEPSNQTADADVGTAEPAGSAIGSSGSQAGPSQPPSNPGSGPDRQAVWSQIAVLAGERNLSMSDLKTHYGEWRPPLAAETLTKATGEQLVGFLKWLKDTRRGK